MGEFLCNKSRLFSSGVGLSFLQFLNSESWKRKKIFLEIFHKISFERIFQFWFRKNFPCAVSNASKIENNGRAPQWKCFSFYHLTRQYFPPRCLSSWWWYCWEVMLRAKIQFSVKLECESNKTTMFFRAILDSKNCHQPVSLLQFLFKQLRSEFII